MTPQTDTKTLSGARKVVSTCLGLLPGQELLIFADETTLDAVRLIHQAAVDQQVHSTILLVPLEAQVRYARDQEFPLPIQAAMRDAMAILTCVSDQPEAMNFRAMIIRTAQDYRTKIGNCPGMNIEMLSTAVDVDYSVMAGRCRLLAVALAKGGTMEIITEDNQGQAHLLSISLGHWERVPITSTGLIKEGIWGNIPSGETYLAPLEDSTEGEIIINGSVPGYVFPKGQEIKLTFRSGELVSIVPDDDSGAQLLQAEIDAARSIGDHNCHRLAEVGVGVNPGVKRLTGKPLMDEKKAGTAHIALGNNTDFGGNLVSSVHLDLVTQAPTIKVNGITVLQHGDLFIRDTDWRDNYKAIEMPEGWAETIQAVSRTGHKTNPRSPRLLQRELIDGAGRVLYISVGDNPTAKAGAVIYSKIPNRDVIPLDQLMADTGLDKVDLLRILKVMQDYEMITLHNLPNIG
jgi:leucyl aminopeptidase (aminopeptidase T)